MIKVRRLARYVSLAAITTGFVIVVSLLALYVVHFGRSDFNSDDAVLSLQARSMWEQGALFPEGWIGNNGDLMMPSWVLLLAPLMAWFPNGYDLHAVAGISSILLMLGTFSVFLRRARLPLAIVLVASTVLASGLSRLSVMMLYLQTTYVWWPSAFFLGATLIWHERESESIGAVRSEVRCAALALVIFLVSLSNPGRALLMVVFPLYVFDRVLALRLNRSLTVQEHGIFSRAGIRDSIVLFGFGTAFAFAALAYYGLFWTGTVHTVHHATNLSWQGFAGVSAHWQIFLSGWFHYLGGMRELNAPISTLEDVLRPLRYTFAIWLTWVGVAEVWRLFTRCEPLRGALAAAFLAAFVPMLLLYVSFAPLAIDTGTIRYFTVSIVLLLAMGAFRVSGTTHWPHWLGHPIAIAFSACVVLASAVRFVPATSQGNLDFFDLRDSFALRIAKTLERENLKWGYATWWNSGVVTVLSEHRIRVNPIEFRGKEILNFPCMIQQRNYQPQAHAGETFLLLRPGEADAARISALRATLGEPIRTVESEDAFIYVYPENISSYFCGAGYRMDTALVPGDPHGRVVQVIRNARIENVGFETISVVVSNEGSEALSGTGRYPISIGIKLLDDSGKLITPNGLHYLLPCVVRPGEMKTFVLELSRVPIESRLGKVGLVQEGVAWFEQWGIESFELEFDGSETDRISVKNMDPQ